MRNLGLFSCKHVARNQHKFLSWHFSVKTIQGLVISRITECPLVVWKSLLLCSASKRFSESCRSWDSICCSSFLSIGTTPESTFSTQSLRNQMNSISWARKFLLLFDLGLLLTHQRFSISKCLFFIRNWCNNSFLGGNIENWWFGTNELRRKS